MKASRKFDLNALRAFASVVETGGFTAAAEQLGTAKARVSLDVARLERQLGRNLFTRTTRRVAPTDAGRAFYEECIPLLRKVEAAAAQLGDEHQQLRGQLRITTTVDHASHSVASAVAEFAKLHSDLSIELITSDRQLNLVKEGIDLAIRVGWLRDSSLRALKLGEFDQYVMASADYLQRAGVPTKPEQLAEHAWIALSPLPSPLTWRFTASSGERRTVRVHARLKTDTGSALRKLLESGAGISALDSFSAQAAMAEGRLTRVLPRWSLPRGGVYAVYPPGRHLAPAARAFVELYRERLSQR